MNMCAILHRMKCNQQNSWCIITRVMIVFLSTAEESVACARTLRQDMTRMASCQVKQRKDQAALIDTQAELQKDQITLKEGQTTLLTDMAALHESQTRIQENQIKLHRNQNAQEKVHATLQAKVEWLTESLIKLLMKEVQASSTTTVFERE